MDLLCEAYSAACRWACPSLVSAWLYLRFLFAVMLRILPERRPKELTGSPQASGVLLSLSPGALPQTGRKPGYLSLS